MTPKLIFIVPYRDRAAHKNHFEVVMKNILEDMPNHEYKIYFVHQCDKQLFNRGAMKNIGFLTMKELYPNDYADITFIFNDIDTTPSRKNLLDYNTEHGVIKHFYGYNFALGGLFSIKGRDFEKCKGFPNYWEWGYEDNIMYHRAINNNITVDRTNFFDIKDMNIIQINDNLDRLIIKRDTTFYQNYKINIDNMNDIHNLKYEIKNEFINVSNFSTSYAQNDFTYKKLITRISDHPDNAPHNISHNRFNQKSSNTNMNIKISRPKSYINRAMFN